MNPDLRQKIHSSQTIFLGGGAAFPCVLVAELVSDPDLLRGKDVTCCFVPGFGHTLPRVLDGSLEIFFGERNLLERPETRFVPMQYRRIWNHLKGKRFDLALVRLVEDDEGGFHYGMGVDFQPAALGASAAIVAEVVLEAPYVRDAPAVPSEALTLTERVETKGTCGAAVVEGATRDRGRHENGKMGAVQVARRIGENVAMLVRDGDCLQIGIGAIPEAILTALTDHKNLGCHSGMISGAMAELHRIGVLTGSSKTLDSRTIVTGFVIGEGAVHQWAAACGQVALRPVSYTHDPHVLASLDNLVSINSAIEVDLGGQVNAEMVGGRQVSGVGGSVDFARGAGLSKGGRSIIALPATARNGTVSRIVRALGAGNCATLLRTDVDFVVTEFGSAELRGTDTELRAERLAAIAGPEFRETLSL